jgi:hypothetical protein
MTISSFCHLLRLILQQSCGIDQGASSNDRGDTHFSSQFLDFGAIRIRQSPDELFDIVEQLFEVFRTDSAALG